MNNVSRHVTFNDTNTSTSKGRVRKEEGLYCWKKICKTILFGWSWVHRAHLPYKTLRYAVNLLQCIFWAFSEWRGRRGRRGRAEFRLNVKLWSAWDCHSSPVPLKLIQCKWFGTCLEDIGRKVGRLLFHWVGGGGIEGHSEWTQLLLLNLVWEFTCIAHLSLSPYTSKAFGLFQSSPGCLHWTSKFPGDTEQFGFFSLHPLTFQKLFEMSEQKDQCLLLLEQPFLAGRQPCCPRPSHTIFQLSISFMTVGVALPKLETRERWHLVRNYRPHLINHHHLFSRLHD